MNPREIEKFQAFFMDKSGLVFEGRRIQEMEKAVAKRMIELSLTSFDDYYRYLARAKEGREELNRLAIDLTVGETRFFRTPDQFAALRKYIVPEIVSRKRKEGMRLRALSAGCSTGEEAYTLAIMFNQLIPDIQNWNIEIVACDINSDFLERAAEGVYGERKLRFVDPNTRSLFFKRQSKDMWRVDDELRRLIRFEHFNLNSGDYGQLTRGEEFQLILCRNVLIYFNMETIKSVINRIHDIIETSGYLMLGYSETLFKISSIFQSIHTPEAFFYQKTKKPSDTISIDLSLSKSEPLQRDEVIKLLGSKPHAWIEGEETRKTRDKVAAETPYPRVKLAEPRPGDGDKDAKPAPPRERKSEVDIGRATRPETDNDPAGDASAAAPPPPAPRDGWSEAEEEKLWRQGLERFQDERFEEAREACEEILANNPESARAHVGLGFLHANLENEEAARRHAMLALEVDDLIPEIYFLFALLDERGGDVKGALRNYQRVILLDSDFAMAHFNLGHLYLQMGKEKDARREFTNTINILGRDPKNESLRFSGGLSAEALIEFCKLQLK